MASELYGLLREAPASPRLTPEEAAAKVASLPASARAVYAALAQRGPLTHKELLQVAGMPGRTVRWALQRLKEEGVVGARCSLMDCRQCYFYVQDHCAGNGLGGVPLRVKGS